jgi:hypothetical protein
VNGYLLVFHGLAGSHGPISSIALGTREPEKAAPFPQGDEIGPSNFPLSGGFYDHAVAFETHFPSLCAADVCDGLAG